MQSWLQAAPSFAIAAAVLFAPGAAIVTAAGARGLRRWTLAVPTTFTVAGLTAIASGAAGIRYDLMTFLLSSLALTLVVAGASIWLRRWKPTLQPTDANDAPVDRAAHRARTIALGAGLLIAATLIGARLTTAIASPEAIAQLFDNIFHLNAVAIVHSTGDGSSLTLGNLTEASQAFYPAAFHDVTSLLLDLGITTPVALNVVSILMSTVVWPLSLVFLASRLFGYRVDVLLLTGILAAAFSAFPYRPLSFGILYPFHAGMTMVVVVVALIVEMFAMQRTAQISVGSAAWALAAVVPGIALAHPSVLIVGLVLSWPFALARFIRDMRRSAPATRPRWRVGLAAAYLGGALIVFILVRPPLTSAPWQPSQSYKEAIGSIVTVSPGHTAISWGLFILAIAGFAVTARRPSSTWPVALMFTFGAAAYFASAAVGDPFLRDLISGVWYRDTERLSVVFTVAAFPLVLGGALALVAAARALLDRTALSGSPTAGVVVATAAVVLVVALVTQRGPLLQAQEWLYQSFGNGPEQRLVTEDERALMKEVPALVPVDGVIVGNPRTGASLTPALAGRATLAPHIYGARTEAEQYLLDHWDDAGTDPEVCPIIESLNAYWALEFGAADIQGGQRRELAGSDSLSSGTAEGIREIARVGEAALYEAAVCGPPSR